MVSKEAPPPVQAPPYVRRPPWSGVLSAKTHSEDFVVPLGVDEQKRAFEPLDFILFFKKKADADRLAEALERALEAFPLCAGRFVTQEVLARHPRTPLTIEALATYKDRVCILCNNAGAGWSALEYPEATPSPFGPASNNFVDFVSETEPTADGQLGGPLFKARLSCFTDGQLLGLSFAQGLCDCKGVSLLLRTWSRLYRGDDPEPPPDYDRLALEDLFRRVEPGKVKLDFALLNKSRNQMPPLAVEKSVVSFSWTAEEVQSRIKEIQDERKNRHLTLDRAGKNLEALDVGCAAILQGFEANVPVRMRVDYRADFEVPLHFGNASGDIAFDTPLGKEDTAEMIRRRVFGCHSREFWAWQRTQNTKAVSTGITIFPLVDDLLLEDACFQPGDVASVGIPLCIWEEQMKSSGYIAVLPEPAGGCHVEALVPRVVAARVSEKVKCKVFPIR